MHVDRHMPDNYWLLTSGSGAGPSSFAQSGQGSHPARDASSSSRNRRTAWQAKTGFSTSTSQVTLLAQFGTFLDCGPEASPNHEGRGFEEKRRLLPKAGRCHSQDMLQYRPQCVYEFVWFDGRQLLSVGSSSASIGSNAHTRFCMRLEAVFATSASPSGMPGCGYDGAMLRRNNECHDTLRIKLRYPAL
jgi:hypothetical protein